jgi:hypothetical protein
MDIGTQRRQMKTHKLVNVRTKRLIIITSTRTCQFADLPQTI